MSTSPNPEQLLRRPKKLQAPQPANTGKIVAASASLAIAAAAIVAFVVFNHGKSAAGDAGASAVAQVAAAPVQETFVPAFASNRVKHAPQKPAAASPKPSPGVSPTPFPTATPDASATPAAVHARTAAEIARAKHEAAVRLAALRRDQAASSSLLNPAGSSNNATSASGPTLTQPSQPLPTQAPTVAPVVATPEPQATPVYAPRVIVDARFIDRVSPAYPEIARQQGAQGTAIVLATVGPRGSVISVDVEQSTGNKLLDLSALAAARASKFEAPEIDGKPATETYRIVYTFDINQ